MNPNQNVQVADTDEMAVGTALAGQLGNLFVGKTDNKLYLIKPDGTLWSFNGDTSVFEVVP